MERKLTYVSIPQTYIQVRANERENRVQRVAILGIVFQHKEAPLHLRNINFLCESIINKFKRICEWNPRCVPVGLFNSLIFFSENKIPAILTKKKLCCSEFNI